MKKPGVVVGAKIIFYTKGKKMMFYIKDKKAFESHVNIVRSVFDDKLSLL